MKWLHKSQRLACGFTGRAYDRARKGAGRKQKYAVKSTAIRVPDVLAPVIKQTKTLSKADLTELSNMIDVFVQNHK